MGTLLLGDGDRATVDIQIVIAKSFRCGHMEVAVHKHVAICKSWRIGLAVNMSVRAKNCFAISKQHGIFHNGEVEEHLVDICIAVALYPNDFVSNCVEKLGNLLRVVVQWMSLAIISFIVRYFLAYISTILPFFVETGKGIGGI